MGAQRELQHGDHEMMFTKYHMMWRALSVAAGPDSVTSFSKTKLKEKKKC